MIVPTVNEEQPLRIDHLTKRLQCRESDGTWLDWQTPHAPLPEYAIYIRSSGPDEYPHNGWFNVFVIEPRPEPPRSIIGFRLPYSCFPALTRHEEIERMIEQM